MNMKKDFALTKTLCLTLVAALACALLSSCGKDLSDTQDPNPHGSEQTAVTEGTVSQPTGETTLSTEVTTAPQTAAEEASGVSETQPAVTEEVSIEDLGLRAVECLELLNSDRVHARLIEAVSYDNESTSSITREYFIDGDNAVYINDNQKVIIQGTEAMVIDLDELSFYTYEVDPTENADNFGYGIDNYSFYSTNTSADGTVTEVYNVYAHGGTLVSTWTFLPSGTITVSDVSPEFGSYYWYSFDIIEDDISQMDMSVPDGLTEVEPDEMM